MRKKIVTALAAGVLAAMTVGATASGAAELKPYNKAAFEAAQQKGEPVVVDIWANWCPTCAAQEPIIKKLAASPEFSDLTIFRVNFDEQRDVARDFGAQSQSTLIAYVGTNETARSVGDTTEAGIEALFRSTLKN